MSKTAKNLSAIYTIKTDKTMVSTADWSITAVVVVSSMRNASMFLAVLTDDGIPFQSLMVRGK